MHPRIEPFAHGRLLRDEGAHIYWETSGNPSGKPALFLHGGPGGGLGRGGYRRHFDPDKHLIVGLDQRGCGRSTPLAVDALEDLDTNTTQTLIADVEALRVHLGIEAWLVHGVSWGSTLGLAYALAHPDRVSELVLMAVTSGSRAEIDWITDDVGRVFPEAWSEFAAVAGPGERPVEAYARLLRDPDPAVRAAAAEAWYRWEATHVSLDPHWAPGVIDDDATQRATFSTLVAHYWANDCFLRGGQQILERVGGLAGIPGVLVHGRRDISSPAVTPWDLHRRWPGSRLVVVEAEGHGGPEMVWLATAAIDGFAGRAVGPGNG